MIGPDWKYSLLGILLIISFGSLITYQIYTYMHITFVFTFLVIFLGFTGIYILLFGKNDL